VTIVSSGRSAGLQSRVRPPSSLSVSAVARGFSCSSRLQPRGDGANDAVHRGDAEIAEIIFLRVIIVGSGLARSRRRATCPSGLRSPRGPWSPVLRARPRSTVALRGTSPSGSAPQLVSSGRSAGLQSRVRPPSSLSVSAVARGFSSRSRLQQSLEASAVARGFSREASLTLVGSGSLSHAFSPEGDMPLRSPVSSRTVVPRPARPTSVDSRPPAHLALRLCAATRVVRS
jgi:hypothetical protein